MRAPSADGNLITQQNIPRALAVPSPSLGPRKRLSVWPTLQLTPSDGIIVSAQQIQPDKRIKLRSTVDPGGIAPTYVDPTVCDLCPSDPDKSAPGQCGCGYADNPSVSVDDVSVDEATGTLQFTVSLSAPCGSAVSVHYATADGTAKAGSDYVPTSGTAQFGPGEVSVKVPVTINDDST